MIDLESKLRDGLHTLAGASPAVEVPPFDTIAARARTDRPHRKSSRLRRTMVFATIGVVGTAGVATATGVLPNPVERTLHEFRSWGFHATRGAELMATVRANGSTHEVWRAPLAGGGQCVYERKIGNGGDVPHGGASQCSPHPTLPTFLTGAFADRTGDGATAWGQVPVGGVAIIFGLSDGTNYEVPVQRDRFFITAFAGVPSGLRIGRPQVKRADGSLYTP